MSLERRMRVVEPEGGGMDVVPVPGIRVAFASNDMEHVNQHFGSAESFAIYQVNMDEAQLIEAAQFGKLEQDGNEDKLVSKLDLLDGCVAVYCQAVGSSAVRQLLARQIQPMKVSEGLEIKYLLDALQEEMRAGPSAWLAKAISRQSGSDYGRFDDMEAEGWDE